MSTLEFLLTLFLIGFLTYRWGKNRGRKLVAPEELNPAVSKSLLILGTSLAGLSLGLLTAFNSGVGDVGLLPGLERIVEHVIEPRDGYLLVGAISGFWTGLITAGVFE